MPTREEIRRSLAGAWQLFLSRPEGMRLFDLSIEGFWRSFGAIWLVLPAYGLAAAAQYDQYLTDGVADDLPGGFTYVVDKAIAIGLDWIALPIILALLAGRLGIARTYPAYMVARNWTAVIGVLPFGIIALLSLLGIADETVTGVLWLAALAVLLRYNFVVARTALGASIGFAVGLVVADFVLSLLITTGLDSLFGVGVPQ
jgi:hypothetical protein